MNDDVYPYACSAADTAYGVDMNPFLTTGHPMGSVRAYVRTDEMTCHYRCPISTRPASPARSPLFGPGPSPARPGTNKRAGLGQEIRHGGLARHGPFRSKPVKPAFFTLKRASRPT
jgi:hypothetical protein